MLSGLPRFLVPLNAGPVLLDRAPFSLLVWNRTRGERLHCIALCRYFKIVPDASTDPVKEMGDDPVVEA